MSPLVAYHATRRACRDSIERHGLLCDMPRGRSIFGVFVYRADGSFDHACLNSRTRWSRDKAQDIWQVSYIGPIAPDRFVINGMVLLMPAEQVTLVAGNK